MYNFPKLEAHHYGTFSPRDAEWGVITRMAALRVAKVDNGPRQEAFAKLFAKAPDMYLLLHQLVHEIPTVCDLDKCDPQEMDLVVTFRKAERLLNDLDGELDA